MEIRLCRKDEEEASWDLEGMVWPRFNQEADDAVGSEYFQELHLLALEGEKIVGTIDACPFLWSGRPEDLRGWSEMVQGSYTFPLDFRPSGEEIWAGAIGTSVLPDAGSQGLSRKLLGALRELALRQGYKGVVAPVRPIFRARAPLLSLEEYSQLRLPDGRHFDPWVRTHESLGGRIVGIREESAVFSGTREQWEAWAGMRLPEEGKILFPASIGTLHLHGGRGRLAEPSIWIVHEEAE